MRRSLAAAAAAAAALLIPTAVAAANATRQVRSLHPGALFVDQPSAAGFSQKSAWGGGGALDDKDKCPPCFNCLLPAFQCAQYGDCNPYDGQCQCPPGFGGQDCLSPLCGSLADGGNRYPREDENASCECSEGWTGLNCNVCKTDDACARFRPRGGPEELGQNGTCYTGGYPVDHVYQMCDVTNRKINDMLPSRAPQVTFDCDVASEECSFQFWIGQRESFYCALSNCTSALESGYDANVTDYKCDKIICSCIPGRMLCGEEGSINIDDFLSEEIKGPAQFQCKTGQGCTFRESAMNSLINDVFGDPYITLDCDAGECVHYSQVPGYERPTKPTNKLWVALSAGAAGVVFLLAVALIWYFGRARSPSSDGFSGIALPSDESSKLMADHVPATLHFSDLSYTIDGKRVLASITGAVRPGQVLAIMGASGAGKSTFLDLLARKEKRGALGGAIFVNGREIDEKRYKRVVGFVDQEDTLMPTLTVYETVLYSALLRLPREMSLAAKKFRTLETMNELGILGIRDSKIGEAGNRSISGGEKRRVSIACELVTSPSIIFLDEPTSGLDSYNAYSVIDSLKTLARDYNRTVVFTIHQPRSNIVALFDQLVVLARGKAVYSGPYEKCQEYFEGIGAPCPPGFNIADYLIDLTMQAEEDGSSPRERRAAQAPSEDAASLALPDEERGLTADETELRTRESSSTDGSSPSGRTTLSRLRGAFAGVNGGGANGEAALPPRLAALVDAYAASDIAQETREEIECIKAAGGGPNGHVEDGEEDVCRLRGYKRATWWTQFKILSERAFKNLYRNPILMLAHYAIAIVLALFCGFLFRNLTSDIAGFQNRMGLFFFVLSLFGFSCLTSLGLFAHERILFQRERSNGYYHPLTYFTSKVLFDILPLRVIPPFILGSIVYGLVGLVPQVAQFWCFILVLVLFNLAAASVVLFISIVIPDMGVANLVGSLVMLLNLLFAGMLINRESIPWGVSWLQTTSFFHSGLEALLVNELRYLQLKEHKFGLDIEVPSATILSTFGFRAQAFWWPDVGLLLTTFGAFIALSYVWLHLFVRERR